MLNCGGTVDLNENLSLPSSSKCLVVDSHRPIHLGNIRSDSRVDFYELNKEEIVVVNDGSIEPSEIPSDISESEEECEEEVNEDEDEESMKRRVEKEKEHELKRLEHDRKRRKLTRYEEYNYYSRPVSFQVSMIRENE